MHIPRLTPHHPPYRHVSPSASTIQSTVPPCCPHQPHYTVSRTTTPPPASSSCCSRGPQAALLSPRTEFRERGRILTRTVPLSGLQAGPTSLRLYQAPVAGRIPSAAVPSCVLADCVTPGVTQGNTPLTAVTGSPVETPVPWEYPTQVGDLSLWSRRPMTMSHCSMPRPGAVGEASHLHFNLVYRGSMAHCQAGTTCHIAFAVTFRLPLPHTQAMRKPLPMSGYHRCAQHMDISKPIHPSHTRSRSITPDSHNLLTRTTVMPQPKNPRVTVQCRPPQHSG